jgi:hypothetical protein
MHKLTASHCAHDFQPVSAAELSLLEQAAGHDFTVSFDGKAFALKPEPANQLVYRKLGVFEIPWISIDSKLNQLN